MQTKQTVVLICIDWFEPAFRAGGPIRSVANLVRQIAVGSQYYIFCSNRDLNNEVLDVKSDVWIDYNAQTKVFYASAGNSRQKFAMVYNQIHPNVIYVNGLYSIPFNVIPLLYGKSVKKVVAPRGMLHEGALLQKKWKKKLFFIFWRGMGWHKKVVFHATNELEKRAIQKFFNTQVQVNVAENFPRLFEFHRNENKQKGVLRMLSLALISPMKNHLLVLETLLHCNYKVHYQIAGPVKDAAYWEQCMTLISKMPENVVVEYVGEIPPHQVESILVKNDVFVMPSESENYAHAIIEAMSSGCPVITSKHTPWNQLQLHQAGINVELNSSELLNAIDRFAEMNAAEFEVWSLKSNEYIMSNIQMNSIINQHKALFSVNS